MKEKIRGYRDRVYVVGQRNEEERKKEKDITVILRKRISMFCAGFRVIRA
jgi:hypothetical protein